VSVQFGRWNFDGQPADREYLAKAEGTLSPYGPDGGGTYIKDSAGILFRALHTTKESRSETQPHITPSGAVLNWDGRLDNGAEFIRELRDIQGTRSTDVSIVAAAYERWGTGCFAKFIGDWALSIWNPTDRSLILAKDPIGTRHLYYTFDQEQVCWSTVLDPLVLLAGKTFALEEEYIAGWLSFFPATHLTPYVGIHSVPPSTSVFIRAGKHKVSKYWDFDPSKRIRYRTDAEYEEHFRLVFAEAVRRRLRSDSPILAELSGGMDSSSIVCMADSLIARGDAETPRLDTLSYYNDSEPNWNEYPYFTKVEEKRGRVGCHIDVGNREQTKLNLETKCFAATPGAGGQSSEATNQFRACMTSQGNCVLLSGIGGDEVLGGVPTPIAQLQNLLARIQFRALAHQLKVWALNKRKPWFHLLLEAARGFFPPAFVGVPKHRRPAPWLHPNFVKRHRAALTGYETRLELLGPLPSFQENLITLDGLRRQVGSFVLSPDPLIDTRYPYLDRDLLEFVYAIPREQLVRPGQRRSLMRRSLIGVVPEELLNRKRKAFVARTPIAAISSDWDTLLEVSQHMISSFLGIVESEGFLDALQNARQGRAVPIVPLFRAIGVEFWLRNLRDSKLLNLAASTKNSHSAANEESANCQGKWKTQLS
jgi:asparagine synthase (glutamine-hydrolysing)